MKRGGCTTRWQAMCRRGIAVGLLLAYTLADATLVEYPPVVPGKQFTFPRDEGSHPEFRIEWWYVTGWLTQDGGANLGFQVTFFRVRPGVDEDNPSQFAAKQLLFAHAALSDPRSGKLLKGEKSAREGFGLASAKTGSLDVAIDNWSLRAAGVGGDANYRAAITTDQFALDLAIRATQPPLLQGEHGFSQKAPDPNSASYYYSQPQLQTSGQIRIGGRTYQVRGTAWLDHEWSNAYVDAGTQGWDWLGLNLDDGGALMVFRMRAPDGSQRWASATRSDTNSHARTFSPADIEWSSLRCWRSPRTGYEYPVEWQIRVGERTIVLKPLMDDQENDTRGSTGTIYWEGAVRAFDERGRPLGRGYLELTGYGKRVNL